ncbi:hypothetical protein Hdeb2414_s0002g00049951 [Helianthus debilis subsp. tardiflorus]
MDSNDQKVRMLACSGGSWTTEDGYTMVYRPSTLMRRTLELPFDSTYSQMKSCVGKKLKLSPHYDFRMSYQLPLSSSDENKPVVVEIADDEDVEIFMDIANKASHGLLTLYISDPDY